jgi:hypothetical protein
LAFVLILGWAGATGAREAPAAEQAPARRDARRHHEPAERRRLRASLDEAPALARAPAHRPPATAESAPPAPPEPPRPVDPDLAPGLVQQADIMLRVRGSRPRLLAFALPRGELGPDAPRRLAGAGWLRLGLSDQIRYRTTTSGGAPGQNAYETELRPFATTNPKLFTGTVTALGYEASLTIPLQSAAGDTPGRYTLIHRGELELGWRSRERALEVSLRQRVEYGDKDFRGPGDGAPDVLDAVPTTDVVPVLNLVTNFGLVVRASETHAIELQLELTRQGGFGLSQAGVDARSLMPQLLSPLAILRDTIQLGPSGAVVISVEGNYNDVSYGNTSDAAGNPIPRGGPSSYALAADVAYRHKTEPGELGASVGAALYSTPARPFESQAQDEVTPNRMVVMAIAALWMTRKLSKTIELVVDGALQPKVDRVAGKIGPRLRAGASLRWRSPSGFFAMGNGDFSLDLGDGQQATSGGASDYFAAKGYQFAARAGIGYQHRRWLAVELGARYQRILREQQGVDNPLPTERWTTYAELRFVWDAIK